MRTRALVACALVAGLVLAPGVRADAAGVTTHAWMALDAVPLVEDDDLRTLLEANLAFVEAGAQFPDSGYWNNTIGFGPAGDYGEEAHWQRFYDAYADQIAADPTCGDLTDPTGPCAPRIAHLMGALGHGIGDEVWDWLFEPQAPDRGESYVPPPLAPIFSNGGAEMQMDLVAIHVHGRPVAPDLPAWPDPAQLTGVFHTVGLPQITAAGLASGHAGMNTLRTGEGVLAPQYAQDILANMPWMAASFTTAPGGVDFAAAAIAPAMDTLWTRILGEQVRTEVSITYPADGEAEVPATGWDRASFLPGSHPDRGGARQRITAVLTYALPYEPSASSPGSLPSQLPEGAMTLAVAGTGDLVPLRAGYPKLVPYGPDSGEHTIDIQPDTDLAECTEYQVSVTERLLDATQRPVVPMSWTFTTEGCPGGGPVPTSSATSTPAPPRPSATTGADGSVPSMADPTAARPPVSTAPPATPVAATPRLAG